MLALLWQALTTARGAWLQVHTMLEAADAREWLQVQTMLEQAGFSRSNPYNIVQQGKIARMSQLSDAQRLDLLKEVGGASLYENKRTESAKEMAAQAEHIGAIDDAVRFCLAVLCHSNLQRRWRRRRSTSAPSTTRCGSAVLLLPGCVLSIELGKGAAAEHIGAIDDAVRLSCVAVAWLCYVVRIG